MGRSGVGDLGGAYSFASIQVISASETNPLSTNASTKT